MASPIFGRFRATRFGDGPGVLSPELPSAVAASAELPATRAGAVANSAGESRLQAGMDDGAGDGSEARGCPEILVGACSMGKVGGMAALDGVDSALGFSESKETFSRWSSRDMVISSMQAPVSSDGAPFGHGSYSGSMTRDSAKNRLLYLTASDSQSNAWGILCRCRCNKGMDRCLSLWSTLSLEPSGPDFCNPKHGKISV